MRRARSLRRLGAALIVGASIAPVAARSDQAGPMLVAVVADRAEATLLDRRGFDLVEMRDGTEIQIVLWPGDAARLRDLGFSWRVITEDLAGEHARAMLPDPSMPMLDWPQTETPRSAYRTLAEHQAEIRTLASTYPSLARIVTLGRSLEGREIIGLEVAIGDRDDGRPQVYIDGVHHAREWPSAEYVTGFAHRLVSDALNNDPRVTDLLRRCTVILVPVVNPDGFTISRSAPTDADGPIGVAAYWRKNARGLYNDADLGITVGRYGVDPNRNYGFGWGTGSLLGGNGASGNPADETYEGEAPASEPEIEAVQDFVLARNITAVITNHTFGNLVLYPWGHTAQPPPDADIFVPLGQQLAAANRYRPQPGIDLYATTGTMDDWAYAATGTLGFTFEHGASFHPTYGDGMLRRPGNEESFLRLVEAGADPTKHAVITGRVVDLVGRGVRATLSLTKDADIPLADGTITHRIATTLRTAADGSFSWHVNPSNGPIDRDGYRLTITSTLQRPSWIVHVNRGGTLALGDLSIAR